MKVHKGDTVLVVSGKDKGAKGKVLQAYPTRNRVLVEGVNRIKKHTPVSRTERGAASGGIVTQEAAIHVSNVMLIDSDGKPTRVSFRVDDETGKKVRVAKTNGKDILDDDRGSHREDPAPPQAALPRGDPRRAVQRVRLRQRHADPWRGEGRREHGC